jgi:hypothetical protein
LKKYLFLFPYSITIESFCTNPINIPLKKLNYRYLNLLFAIPKCLQIQESNNVYRQAQLFIMLLYCLEQHVSTHIKSSSGPFWDTDPYLTLKMHIGIPHAYTIVIIYSCRGHKLLLHNKNLWSLQLYNITIM